METGIIILICVVVGVVTVPLAVARILMRRFICRYDMSKHSFSLRLSDMNGKFTPRHVQFPSGANTLHGYVFGEANTGGLVVFCHGLFGGAAEYFAFARHFVNEGYTVFMFDNTGCNMSEGKSIIGSMQGLDDLRAAFLYLNEHEKTLMQHDVALIGHSWGGFAVAAYGELESNVKCVISLAGYDTAPRAICDFLTGLYGRGLKVALPYCRLVQLLQYGKRGLQSSVSNINRTELPYLIVQGTNDRIIQKDSSAIYAKRDKVTNTKAQFILRDDPMHNKHNTIFRDAQATLYMESRYKLMREAKAHFSGEARERALDDIFNETDRMRINTLDEDIMKRIDAMIKSNCGKRS